MSNEQTRPMTGVVVIVLVFAVIIWCLEKPTAIYFAVGVGLIALSILFKNSWSDSLLRTILMILTGILGCISLAIGFFSLDEKDDYSYSPPTTTTVKQLSIHPKSDPRPTNNTSLGQQPYKPKIDDSFMTWIDEEIRKTKEKLRKL